MLAERKLSSKINYDVLRGLKSEDSTSSAGGGGYDIGAGIDLKGGITPKIEATTTSDLSTIAEEESEGEETSSGRHMAVVYESGPTLSSKRAGNKRR